MFTSPSYTFTLFATVHYYSSGFDIDSKIVVYKDGKKENPYDFYPMVSVWFTYESIRVHYGGTTNAPYASKI